MKRINLFLLMLVILAMPIVATNTTSSSKGYMIDATSGWWYSSTYGIEEHVVTIDYVKGDTNYITLTAGCRFTNDDALVATTTYYVPIIDGSGAATTDPITISTAGAYVFRVKVPKSADQLYVLVEYDSGTTGTVNINAKPDVN